MYWVVATANVLFAGGLLFIAGRSAIATPWVAAVALASVIMTCAFWIAYPPHVGSPLSTPSTGGLRFLPVVLLVCVLMLSETNRWAARHWMTLGSSFFAIGAAWSPESLFYVAFVWGPYLCARRMAASTDGERTGRFVGSVSIIALTLAGVLLVLLAVYRFGYGVWPSPSAYLAYFLYTPGPLPVSWRGPVWYILAGLGLGVTAVMASRRVDGETAAFRQLLLVLLLAYATVSYALGRSHDNNFLNLLPFISVLLLFVLASLERVGDRAQNIAWHTKEMLGAA